MRLLFPLLLLLAGMSAEQIPSKFFGRFVHDHSENFDAFLASKGVNWFLRKMIQFTSVTKVISKGSSENSYTLENLSSKKNTKYADWKLGETFQAEGLDSTMHNITFNFAEDTLRETHIRIEQADAKPETYHYSIDNDDSLLLKMENNGISCRRFFKRIEAEEKK